MKTYQEFINEAQVRFSKNLYKDKVSVDVLNKLIESDPSDSKSYSDWIVKGYLKMELNNQEFNMINYMKSFENWLNEKLDDYNLYHFTDINSLKNIIIDEYIIPSHQISEDETPIGISTTRLKNLMWEDVRLTFDKRELQFKYKIKPIHWFNIQKINNNDYRQYGHDKKLANGKIPVNQFEERIITKTGIPIRYVKEIQIKDKKNQKIVKRWLDDNSLNIPISIR